MKTDVWFLFLLGFLSVACQSKTFEKESGQVESFAEMVAAGVKPIALGSPMRSAELDLFMPEAERLAQKYQVEFIRESDFPKNLLFPNALQEGEEVLIFYAGDELAAYQSLKSSIENSDGSLASQLKNSRRLGRLLGYPVWKINELIEQNSPFRDLEDFGILGQELNWYYQDLARAKAFYSQKIGLKLLVETESSATFEIAGDSRLVLYDLSKSPYEGSEPKSVALALLTTNLDSWYAHLQAENIPVKYPLKRNHSGPHDGFVAVDPEGYLLEFETFYQHPENEGLIPELEKLSPQETSLGADFSFVGSITWLYYKDMLPAQQFMEENLGLRLSADQGWAKIYRLSSNSYIALVDGLRGMNSFSEEKLADLKISLQDPEGWEEYLQSTSRDSSRKSGSFKDSGLYTIYFK
ncbi:MAG: VOC family protein [Algoriphagus sp.]|uniref:VOC family protein n=1 Tax=Algoriphagus sp. TaxID=1872435 RepID=UPI0018033C29|nr:VOC family protein [Algoriphagus sp.]NVJ86843.1 VOC family protein [Algoriphagus sp.]